jgi:ABC-type Na+ efflux pump permease subunit
VQAQAGGVNPVTVTVNQAGKPEYVSMGNVSASKEGGNVTITGKSNTLKLMFTLGTGSLEIELPATYTANGVQTSNGVAIAGDPGASAEYNFSIVIPVPENESVDALHRQVIATTNGGQSATSTITQTAGDPVMTVTPVAVSLDWEGNAVPSTVESNTEWEVV